MTRKQPYCFLACLALLRATNAIAQIDVDITVTSSGSAYHYDVSVSNNSALDLTLVTLSNAPKDDALIEPSLTAPADFLAFYTLDGGLGFGLIDFLEDASTFPVGVTVGPFTFESAVPPFPYFTSFEALDIDGQLFTGTVRIAGAQPPVATPDAASTMLLTLFASFALGVARIGTKSLPVQQSKSLP